VGEFSLENYCDAACEITFIIEIVSGSHCWAVSD